MIQQFGDTIVQIAQERAKQHPDRNYVTFLVDGDDEEATLSYGELDRTSGQVASWMRQNGLNKGDRALVILPNSLGFTKIFFGCLYGGILAVPLSEPAGPHQMKSYLETFVPTVTVSKPKLLVTTPMLVDFIKNQLPGEIAGIFSDTLIVSDEEILTGTSEPMELPLPAVDDTAYLQFTSGSTGTPKGIMIGHCNIMANMREAYKGCDWKEGNGTALWLPLFHDFGLAAGMIGALYMGGFVILATPVHFILKPIRWLRMISKYGCAHSYAPPFAYELCRKKITPEEKKDLNLESLVCSVYGAEPVQYIGVKLFNDYFADCGLKPNAIRPGFGMAETVIMFSVSDHLRGLCVNRSILESENRIEFIDESTADEERKYLVDLGPMMDGHEIVIKDDSNQPLPEGTVGEIMISGPSVCQGYFENPEATEQIFRQKIAGKSQPFLSTGDLGILWEGNLYFTGRIKDLIIIRGRNYYPQDIEYTLTLIKELRAGCIVAFAIDDEEEGEQLALAMEVRKDLLKDMDMFNDYVLPTIDKKVTELIGEKFQIHPEKRYYLEPGVILKTSSGKIKHQTNVKIFRKGGFRGLIATLPLEKEAKQDSSDIAGTVRRLFKKIVELEPVMDEPFLELGGDSIKVVEFVETLQERFPVADQDIMDDIDETTTLNDIVQWFESRI